MGRGHAYRCPECGYSFTVYEGHGALDERMFVPEQYDLLSKMSGLEKEYFPQNSNAALITILNRSLGRCPDCGQYKILEKETIEFYTEKKEKKGVKKIGEWNCIHGTRFIRQSNRCEYCGSLVNKVHQKEIVDNMICPHCNIKMEHTGDLMWD